MIKCSKGFTLAEILIVLTLLGVVAAITIPTVITNVQQRETVVKVNRMYSDLQRAFDTAVAINGPIETWININTNWDMGYRETVLFDRLIAPNFPVTQSCGIRGEGCFVRSETECKSLDGTVLSGNIHFNPCSTWNRWNQTWHWVGSYNRSSTKNGYAIAIQSPRSTWANAEWGHLTDKERTPIASLIAIDINGNKGPNTTGIDIFVFGVTTKGIVTFGPNTDNGYPNNCNPNRKSETNGFGCSHWILTNKNLRYLRR